MAKNIYTRSMHISHNSRKGE